MELSQQQPNQRQQYQNKMNNMQSQHAESNQEIVAKIPLTISIKDSSIPNTSESRHALAQPSHQQPAIYQQLDRTLAYVRKHLPADWYPKVAIICGSGLGGLAETVQPISPETDGVTSINYSDIPHFSQSTVQGHVGKLVFGLIENQPSVLMVGRFHFYEGHPLTATTYPIRLFSLLGVKMLLVTNASGSLNHSQHRVGNVMIIKDHLNLPGMAGGLNPLAGPNLDRFGPRFPPMSEAYDKELRILAREAAKECGIQNDVIHEGVYCFLTGPSYETMAEARFLKVLGGDAVGMSTVPEVIVAVHCGIKVLGLSLITNLVKLSDEDSVGKANHEEVLLTSQLRAREMQSLVRKILIKLNF